jgi:hypothetical protein
MLAVGSGRAPLRSFHAFISSKGSRSPGAQPEVCSDTAADSAGHNRLLREGQLGAKRIW